MKRLFIASSMLVALVITIAAFTAHAKAEAKNNERATVEFTQTVKLLDVVLRGEYLVVHDDERMAKGDACTYIYDKAGKLVVSFHCTPAERPKSDRFRVVTRRLDPNGLSEIIEIQFAGTTKAHVVQ